MEGVGCQLDASVDCGAWARVFVWGGGDADSG